MYNEPAIHRTTSARVSRLAFLFLTQVDEEADGAPLREEDAADRDARLAAEQAAREEAEFRKRSQAVQRYLPRPGYAAYRHMC